jgi:hypothetical protein
LFLAKCAMSASGPMRPRAMLQLDVGFWGEAEAGGAAEPAASVED